MSDDGGQPDGQIAQWIKSWATLIGPASLLTALLFYFGYVSSRSQYEYFGIDVDAIGLSTQDYVMRSPQPLLVPLLVITLIGAGLLLADNTIHNKIADTLAGRGNTDSTQRPGRGGRAMRLTWWIRATMLIGLCLLASGVVLLFAYPIVRDWAYYNLVTPLLLAVGGGLAAYAPRISGFLRSASTHPPTASTAETTSGSALGGRVARMLVYLVIAASVFWATATVAQWSGRGLAQEQARHLDQLPYVILDTKDRMFLRSPGVEETQLPAMEGQLFRYRYRHLRLLIVGDERMFLVPDTWSASNSTLVVPLDDTVRVQFQFQNQHP